MPKIAAIGEVMLELAPAGETHLKQLSFAGDTYNTIVTLARLGVDCVYATRVGDDPFSAEIMARLETEGIATDAVECVPGRVPGLYMIHNRVDGEREFFYWRSSSPAREMFSSPPLADLMLRSLERADWIYFSGITLAILSVDSRRRMFEAMRQLKQRGKQVAFDSNYRPRLWSDADAARQAIGEALTLCDLALLTLDDEALLWGTRGDALAEARARFADLSIPEIVFKRGAEDVVIVRGDSEERVAVNPVHDIVDTTAAGDNFNAGYLAARSRGLSPQQAAQEANKCAGIIIRHRGGVIAKETFMREYHQIS